MFDSGNPDSESTSFLRFLTERPALGSAFTVAHVQIDRNKMQH